MPRCLPSLNHLILGLHEQAAVLAPAQFGQAVLRQCQALLGFDSAMFGSGTIQLAAGRVGSTCTPQFPRAAPTASTPCWPAWASPPPTARVGLHA